MCYTIRIYHLRQRVYTYARVHTSVCYIHTRRYRFYLKIFYCSIRYFEQYIFFKYNNITLYIYDKIIFDLLDFKKI